MQELSQKSYKMSIAKAFWAEFVWPSGPAQREIRNRGASQSLLGELIESVPPLCAGKQEKGSLLCLHIDKPS